jgi:hypothetical protein
MAQGRRVRWRRVLLLLYLGVPFLVTRGLSFLLLLPCRPLSCDLHDWSIQDKLLRILGRRWRERRRQVKGERGGGGGGRRRCVATKVMEHGYDDPVRRTG